MFPETYSQILESSIEQTEYLGKMLDNSQLDTTNWADDTLSLQMNQVAKIMKMRSELGNERDVFMLKLGGWDTHSDLKEDFNEQLTKINDALSKFHEEIKTKQGLWDNVTIVSISDFGRTLTSNGKGTDHAWGGNYFIAGGGVKGKNIFGKYPEELGANSDLNLGRGRILPTTSWEAMWNSIAQWFGVVDSEMDTVLPNKKNFPSSDIFDKNDLFEEWA